jgi:uncharacterized MAPEG superfamily protein
MNDRRATMPDFFAAAALECTVKGTQSRIGPLRACAYMVSMIRQAPEAY